MMAVGVQQHFRIAHDADMALPENEIAAAQMPERRIDRKASPSAACCRSVSRGATSPASASAI